MAASQLEPSSHSPDNAVTVRDRDTMQQERIPISELKAYLAERIKF